MTSEPKIPKDLGVKIGSELEVMWTQVRDRAKNELKQAEGNIILHKAVIVMASKKLLEEKRKRKV